MKFITYQQYIEYLKSNTHVKIREEGRDYKIVDTEEKLYDEKRIKEVDKKHDKMFRSILSRKKEMANFLNQFLELKEKIEEKQIIQCHTDFITRQYKDKHSDIIYKLKDEPVYFLIEHQSTVDKEMPLRIWEYVGEIIRTETMTQETYFRKDKIMFCGDFIFRDNIGRWDLPGGNLSDMISSIKKIKKYDDDIVIYPGHGEKTSLSYEKNNNMYLLDIDYM